MWDSSTAAPADTAHSGIGQPGSVTKITPWDHGVYFLALIPFPLKKSMLAKRREQELLEVLGAVSQLSSGNCCLCKALRLVPGERLLRTWQDEGHGGCIGPGQGVTNPFFVCVCVLISFVKRSCCMLGPV